MGGKWRKTQNIFLNLEKRNYNIKYIKCLVTHENKTINDPNEILKAQFDFYKALYTSKQTRGIQIENFINKNELGNMPTLSPEQKELCDTPLVLTDYK